MFDLDEFSVRNCHRCESESGFNHVLNAWSLAEWMTATVGELGEAANVIKKINRERDGVRGNTSTAEELREQLRREIADAFIYLDLLSQAAGFRLSEAVTATFEMKSRQIGYAEPVKTMPVEEQLSIMGVKLYEVCEGEMVGARSADEAVRFMQQMTSDGILDEVAEVDPSFYRSKFRHEDGRECEVIDVMRAIHFSDGFPQYVCSSNC